MNYSNLVSINLKTDPLLLRSVSSCINSHTDCEAYRNADANIVERRSKRDSQRNSQCYAGAIVLLLHRKNVQDTVHSVSHLAWHFIIKHDVKILISIVQFAPL